MGYSWKNWESPDPLKGPGIFLFLAVELISGYPR